jgi:predicted Zn-dependent protease
VLAPPVPGIRHRHIGTAQICLDPEKRGNIGFDGSLAVYDVAHTIAHEIGHALGLDHAIARDQVMSFRYHEWVAGLGPGDFDGAVAIYPNFSLCST